MLSGYLRRRRFRKRSLNKGGLIQLEHFFPKSSFFKNFLSPCNYLSWNRTNTISIWVCCCLGNTVSFVKSVKKYSHYKHWVKIKTFDGSKLFFADTAYTDLGDKPQIREFFFFFNLSVCSQKCEKNGVFYFVKNNCFTHCANSGLF